MPTSFKTISCTLCNKQSTFYRKIDSHELMRCQSCGVVHLKEVSTSAEGFLEEVNLDENKGKLEYWGYPEIFKKHKNVFDFFFQERYLRIKRYIHYSGPWLDIGSGYGLWQSFLKKKNQSNVGIEIEKNAYLYSKEIGIEVQHVSIEEFTTNKKFAAITMCDVLEHVEDPLSVLKKCHDLLIPGGLLYLQVPNVMGLKYPFGDTLGLPHHLWQFDPKTLPPLTVKAGFKIVKLWTGVQGVIKYYETGGPGLFRKALWSLARWSKRGNRLQLLVRK